MNFKQYVDKKKREYGNKFDKCELAEKFVPYFESGGRIEVKSSSGEVKRGTIGVTTGWKPTFLLMLTKRSTGSIFTLGNEDEIIKIM